MTSYFFPIIIHYTECILNILYYSYSWSYGAKYLCFAQSKYIFTNGKTENIWGKEFERLLLLFFYHFLKANTANQCSKLSTISLFYQKSRLQVYKNIDLDQKHFTSDFVVSQFVIITTYYSHNLITVLLLPNFYQFKGINVIY